MMIASISCNSRILTDNGAGEHRDRADDQAFEQAVSGDLAGQGADRTEGE